MTRRLSRSSPTPPPIITLPDLPPRPSEVDSLPAYDHRPTSADTLSASDEDESWSLPSTPPPVGIKHLTFPSNYDVLGFPLTATQKKRPKETSTLNRRCKKWDGLLSLYPTSVPPKSHTIKKYIRRGIPHHLRPKLWFRYAGAEDRFKEDDGLFAYMCCWEERDIREGYTKETNKVLEAIAAIDRDVYRTFPENAKFESTSANKLMEESNPHILSLRRILVAFAYYTYPHPSPPTHVPIHYHAPRYNIGYCQGLNFIAGLLLLVFTSNCELQYEREEHTRLDVECRVFYMLVTIVENLLPEEMYGDSLDGVRAMQQVFWSGLVKAQGSKFGIERVAKWVEAMENGGAAPSAGEQPKRKTGIFGRRHKKPADGTRNSGGGANSTPSLSMITTQWFLTLFVNALPIHTTLRVWDAFFYQGEKVLYRVALTLLKVHEDEIVHIEDPVHAWKFIKDIPSRHHNASRLLQQIFKPRHVIALKSARNLKEPRSPLSPISPVSDWDNEMGVRERAGVGSVGDRMVGKFWRRAVKVNKSRV
ncbi:rab-GTPase-TBC domain-containing protein [Gaertneriomyces semiglobifer]|nr:rab-GTPase-TBC domain-containing protein [Gaertneriomyces semiglobifer]